MTSPMPLAAGKRPDDVTILASSRLLGRLSAQELGDLLDRLDQVALTRDNVLVSEGEPLDTLYFVLEGELKATRGSIELGELGPGAHFGEASLLGEARAYATITSRSIVRLARLSRARFVTMSNSHPRVALHLVQSIASGLGSELANMTDRVGLLLKQRSLPRRTSLAIDTDHGRVNVPPGTTARALLTQFDGLVAATVDRKPVSLESALVSDSFVGALTTADLEGRLVYQRSAALLLLEAARTVAPHLVVRMGASIDAARIVDVDGAEDRPALAASITHAMEHLIAVDAPLSEELWAIEEARSLFRERGWLDAAALLPSRRSETVTLVGCGGTFAISTGPVVPSARSLVGCRVTPHESGLLLELGDPVRRELPTRAHVEIDPVTVERRASRWGGSMSREMWRWLSTMGSTSVGAFNEGCITGRVDELIRVAEGFHEKHIGKLADTLWERRAASRMIAIAGPSSSGKTTFIRRLSVQLEVNGLRPVGLSLDDYYVDRDKNPKDEAGALDFESLRALDLELLSDHVARLLSGERVKTARFDFKSGRSDHTGGPELQLGPKDVLVVEGIHGLNPALLGDRVSREKVFGVFVHPATALPIDRLSVVLPEDVRLLRRIVRDRHGRNYTAAESIARWASVRRGEQLWIYPHVGNADVVFDSSLVYELGVLKVYAERYLLEVPERDPAFTTAYRLRQLIDAVVAIHPDHVPPTSLVREFIGGSSFER